MVEHFLLTPADLTPVLACRGHVNSCGMALLRKTLPYLGYGPVFPESFRLVLKSHLKANPRNHYLFESRRFWAFSPGACSKLLIGTGNGQVLPNLCIRIYSVTRCSPISHRRACRMLRSN
jgi:hypothetical protein